MRDTYDPVREHPIPAGMTAAKLRAATAQLPANAIVVARYRDQEFAVTVARCADGMLVIDVVPSAGVQG